MKAELHILVENRNGISFLKNSYARPPFKVANITEDKKGPTLKLMLMSSSPGILDDDQYEINIQIGPEATLELQTQSYQRLYQMSIGARQDMEITLENGASLHYLPHPTVPHSQSIFHSRQNIYLNEGCRLIWGEIITCGRRAQSEIFMFTLFHSLTKVYLKNQLVIKENIWLEPATQAIQNIGQWEGYTHQASLICLDEALDTDVVIDNILGFLNEQDHLAFGITKTPIAGFMVRLSGHKAEKLFSYLQYIAQITTLKPVAQ